MGVPPDKSDQKLMKLVSFLPVCRSLVFCPWWTWEIVNLEVVA